jgi:phosphoenolpyruvate-protein kinase (PTS system EI component)
LIKNTKEKNNTQAVLIQEQRPEKNQELNLKDTPSIKERKKEYKKVKNKKLKKKYSQKKQKKKIRKNAINLQCQLAIAQFLRTRPKMG